MSHALHDVPTRMEVTDYDGTCKPAPENLGNNVLDALARTLDM
jgi:hypothetical protein